MPFKKNPKPSPSDLFWIERENLNRSRDPLARAPSFIWMPPSPAPAELIEQARGYFNTSERSALIRPSTFPLPPLSNAVEETVLPENKLGTPRYIDPREFGRDFKGKIRPKKARLGDVGRGVFKSDFSAWQDPWDWSAREAGNLTKEYVGKGSEIGSKARGAFGRHWQKGLAAILATGGLIYWGSRFSGKDDAYNTIEGMPEYGLAVEQRHILTDFGSGYKGDKSKEREKVTNSNTFGTIFDLLEIGTAVGSSPNIWGNLRIAKGYVQGGMTFYHGTGIANVESIKSKGIVPNKLATAEARAEVKIKELVSKLKSSFLNADPLSLVEYENKLRLESIDMRPLLFTAKEKAQAAAMEEKLKHVYFSAQPEIARIHAAADPEKRLGPFVENMQSNLGYYSKKVRGGKKEGAIFEFFLPMDKIVPQRGIATQMSANFPEKFSKVWSWFSQATNFAFSPTIDLSLEGEVSPEAFKRLIPAREGKILWGEAQVLGEGITARGKPQWGKALGRVGLALVPIALAGHSIYNLLSSDNPEEIPKENKGYNNINGLHPGNKGMATKIIRDNTPFGSKIDRVKQLAQMAGLSFEKFIETPAFTKALAKSKVVKVLGEGAFGRATLREASVMGETLQFVEKTPIQRKLYGVPELDKAIDEMIGAEGSVLKNLGQTEAAPSYYGAPKKSFWRSLFGMKQKSKGFYMEFIPGSTAGEVYSRTGESLTLSESGRQMLQRTAESAAKKGLRHGDINPGNIIYHPLSGEAYMIDWGIASKVNPLQWESEAASSVAEITKLSQFASKTPLMRGKLPARGEAFNGFNAASEGGLAAELRHKNTPHGSKIDALKLLLQGEKLGMSIKDSMAWARSEGVRIMRSQHEGIVMSTETMSAFASNRDALGRVIHVDKAKYIKDLESKLGRTLSVDETKIATRMGIVHEVLEAKYLGELASSKIGIGKLKQMSTAERKGAIDKILEEHMQGSHISMGVVKDEIAIARQESKQALSLVTEVRAAELKQTRQAIKSKASALKSEIGGWGLDAQEKAAGALSINRDVQYARQLKQVMLASELQGKQKVIWRLANRGGKGHLHPAGKFVK